MKIDRLPTKLAAEPLLEAVCEVRFTSRLTASAVLPGVLFAGLSSEATPVKLHTLPAAEIPRDVRHQVDDALRFAPLVGLEWNGYRVSIGDASLSVSRAASYPGWTEFKRVITQVFELAAKSQVMDTVDRYSVKYVDLITTALQARANGLDLDLRLGLIHLNKQVTNVRIEVHDAPFVHVLQALTSAAVQQNGGPVRIGSLTDVDTICILAGESMGDFLQQLPGRLEDAHTRNKKMFFECLTEETLQSLGPQYD